MAFTTPTFNETSAMFVYLNSITNELFVPMMLLISWFVMFFLFKLNWRTETAFASSSFIILLMSIILRAAALISDWIVMTIIVVFLAGVFIVAKQGSEDAT